MLIKDITNMKNLDHNLIPQTILAEINANRNKPHLVLPCYAEKLQYFEGFNYVQPGQKGIDTAEGKAAVVEYIDFLLVQDELPGLIQHEILIEIAEERAKELSKRKSIECPDNGITDKTPEERIGKSINWEKMCGECLYVGSSISGADIAATLLIDDGNEERTNRKLLLNKDARFIGIGLGSNERLGTIAVIEVIGGEQVSNNINQDY